MFTLFLGFNISFCMFGADISNFQCKFKKFIPSIIRLDYNTFIRFNYVMFKPDNILQSKSFSWNGTQFNCLVIHRVCKIESNPPRKTTQRMKKKLIRKKALIHKNLSLVLIVCFSLHNRLISYYYCRH